MNPNIDRKFEEAKGLLDRVSRPLQLVGVWPVKRTSTSNLRFVMFITYFSTHLCMEYCDLLVVFGDIQSMVLNLMESGLQSMIILRLFCLRYRKIMHQIVIAIQDDVIDDNYDDPNEKKIYIKYSSIAAAYHKFSVWLGWITAINWYFMPLQNYGFALMQNATIPLITPYRIRTGFDISSMKWTISIYIYQMPMIFTSVCYVATFNFIIVAVTNICAKIAVLSYNVNNLAVHRVTFTTMKLSDVVEKHLKIIRIVDKLDKAFNLIFFYELINTTVLIGLLLYCAMVNLDNAEPMALVLSLLYAATMMMLVFVNCLMGEYLATEAAQLLASYYECSWYEMPLSFQRDLIICMMRAQVPMHLTAAKFYVYSLSSFTSILKSSMAYVSMLRTMI
uniref:Odorant receptor n=1 Tax=Meteorus pulchricornis TaxID=51522 RepID=A0A1S5VFM2_9HYME|nr:olfactory receptor 28 [Meteorus pulchricornis]